MFHKLVELETIAFHVIQENLVVHLNISYTSTPGLIKYGKTHFIPHFIKWYQSKVRRAAHIVASHIHVTFHSVSNHIHQIIITGHITGIIIHISSFKAFIGSSLVIAIHHTAIIGNFPKTPLSISGQA